MMSFSLQQQFGIKTAGMDDKCTAMQMLVVYAKDLQDGFADYAEEVCVCVCVCVLDCYTTQPHLSRLLK